MEWINNFQLFLFDFDGLLVDSEKMHYLAYRKMCKDRGFELPWSFNSYCLKAHYSQERLKEAIYEELPKLYDEEPNWNILYEEKKNALSDLLNNGEIEMMPGSAKLLSALEKADILRCVVTHSSDEQVNIIRQKNPILDTIPFWFTRDSYSKPKPDPECYLYAIEKLGKGLDKIIGFEDSPKGLNALLQTKALPILITQVKYPQIPEFIKQGAVHATSLDELRRIINPH